VTGKELVAEPVERSGIQVISRAMEILRALQAAPAGLTQAEVAARIGLARTTVHRILNSLEDEGLVVSDRPRGRYRLGPEIPRMADAVRRAVVGQVHPYLVELSRQVDETIDLSVLDQNQATFVDQVMSNHRLRAVSAVGESFPLHCTANGKAFLAALPPGALAAALPATLPALTPYTITSLPRLRADLETVRAEGVAYDREEHTVGICAVGAVLRGLPGPPVAVSVPMPVQRFHGREPEFAAALLDWTRRTQAAITPDG
jgi:DNA-binding IclR family transcriptional regulator